MSATQTPTEPTRSRGGVIALVVAGIVVLFLVVGVALASVLGLFVVTSSSDQSPPVVVEEEPVPAPVPVPDGDMFGFVTELDAGSVALDPARMLSGQEAREAATADGVIGPDEDLPNDLYIDNPDTDLLILPVTEDVRATVLSFDSGGGITETDITLSELAVAFTGEYSGVAIYGLVAGEFPMTVVVEDGTVVEMTQVYLP